MSKKYILFPQSNVIIFQGVIFPSAVLILGGAAAINTFINLNQESDIQDDQDSIDDLLKRVASLESRRKFPGHLRYF